jgi:O-antigen ligase
MNYWEGAWDLIQESPLLGFGSLNFQSTYLRVKRSIAAETPADPHNFLLEIAHAGGWGLLGLTLFFIAAVGWFGWRARVKSRVEHGHELFPEHRFTLRGSQVAMVLSGLFVLGFAFFTVGDEELVGTALAAVVAGGMGVWMVRNGSASESMLGIVRDKSV